ncbi:MAG: terminase large subunit [Lachnospiraceae bacterium]|nr:terminase large subunit [Lachnospiraceae bacterium]
MLITKKKIWTPDNSFLLEYQEKIESGDIIAGRELRQELKNLKEDFKNDEYFYDTEDALLRMDFMQNCVRLTKSPFYNKPMMLMLWQKALIETVYSFKMARESEEEGKIIDRFKKILLLIARKNGKSETCSGLGLTELVIGNEGADIVCSSNDDNQARITYEAIDTMRRLIDPRDKYTRKNQLCIRNKSTNSKVFKLSERTENKEGRNIDFAIVDETHEMLTNEIAKSIEQSQSIKDNPKFFEITTEGFKDGFLDEELKMCREIINGEDDTEVGKRWLPWLYTQDSESEIFTDSSTWAKSNPTIGIVKKAKYLEEQLDLAKKSKADRIFVLCKDFNIKQNGSQAWLDESDYKYKATYNIEDFKGAVCLGAVDLSETGDLTNAKILLMKPNDNIKYIHSRYFIPERKLTEDTDKQAGAKYKEWAEKGLIEISEGNDNDLTKVADWFYYLYKEYNIKLYKCGYDQRFAKEFLNRMEEIAWGKEDLEMILQNAHTLNNSIRLCENDFKKRLINYNENEIDRWCLKNASLQLDNQQQCLIVKNRQDEKIDGAVTLAILYEMYRRYRGQFMRKIGAN